MQEDLGVDEFLEWKNKRIFFKEDGFNEEALCDLYKFEKRTQPPSLNKGESTDSDYHSKESRGNCDDWLKYLNDDSSENDEAKNEDQKNDSKNNSKNDNSSSDDDDSKTSKTDEDDE